MNMKYTIGFMALIIVAAILVVKFTPKVYEVRFDYANGEVVEIRDEAGRKVSLTLEDLKQKGIMYSMTYVQPRTMSN